MTNRLKKAVAIACERAYRRGFQHGTLADKTSENVVHDWRARAAGGNATTPPGFGNGDMTALERLEIEEPKEFLRALEDAEASEKALEQALRALHEIAGKSVPNAAKEADRVLLRITGRTALERVMGIS